MAQEDDTEDPRIEKVARAMTAARGLDPDATRPATGYDDAPIVENWRMDVEWAIRHLAAHDLLTSS